MFTDHRYHRTFIPPGNEPMSADFGMQINLCSG